METTRTICAPSHDIAIELFIHYLAPSIVRKEAASTPGLLEALNLHLLDNAPRILNEGAVRDLPERFCKVIEISESEIFTLEGKGLKLAWYMGKDPLKWIVSDRSPTYNLSGAYRYIWRMSSSKK